MATCDSIALPEVLDGLIELPRIAVRAPPGLLALANVAWATSVVGYSRRRAWRVISLGPGLSTVVPPEIPLETWSVPAVSDGYETARDVIVADLRALLTAAQAATSVRGRVLDRADRDRPSAR